MFWRGVGGEYLHKNMYKLFTLGTVSCFSELNIHCFKAHTLQNEQYYGTGAKSELEK